MRSAIPLYPVVDIAKGAALGVSLFFLVMGFGAACGAGLATSQCLVDAVAVLPPNPDEITVGVARELGRRIQACEQQSGDAGR